MKQFDSGTRIKIPQHKNDEMLVKLLESLRNACLAMIDTIDAYREVTDKRGK